MTHNPAHALPCRGWLRLLVFLSPCLLVSLSPYLLVCAVSAEAPEDDPLPVTVRRILLPLDRLAGELEKARQGALVQMPLAEFDALLERASKARRAARNPPRLVEAHYRAALEERALVGSAEWKILYSQESPGLLVLQPFNLALRQARLGNREALVAEFDGRTPALRIETGGEQTATLEWSARGEARPEGLHFDLQFPSCAVAFLELELPGDRIPIVSEGMLLAGPEPAERSDWRRWKIGCGRRTEINLLVRQAEGPGRPEPVVLTRRLKTTQDLRPEGLEARYEFDLEVLHQGVSEVRCECDPALRPCEVSVRNLESWEVKPGATPGAPSLLIARFREPFREGTLQVRCLAPLAEFRGQEARVRGQGSGGKSGKEGVWVSPGVRVVGAVPGGETLLLSFHPDLRLEDWNPGTFRVTEAATDTDQTRRVALVGGGVEPEGAPPGTPPKRPSARLRPPGVAFRARQLAWWQLRGSQSSLTLQIAYEVNQGQLFQLPVLLPGGWEVDRVDVSPGGLLRNWAVRAEGSRRLLTVDLQRPLTSAPGYVALAPVTPAASLPTRSRLPTLTIYLRPGTPGSVVGRDLPFPDAEPVGARFREGALAIDFEETVYQAALLPPRASSEPEEEGPWGKQVPDYYFTYRDKPLIGALRLRPRAPLIRTQCSSDVFLAAGRAAVETRLVLEAEAGRPETIELYLSAAGANPRDWHVEQGSNGIRTAERLPGVEAAGALAVLASANPGEVAALHLARPPGERWRITLMKPLRPREPLVLRGTRRLGPGGGLWRVPLPAVLNAGRLEGEVTLHLAGSDLIRVEAVGLREARPAISRARAPVPWRTFRYSNPAVALTLHGQTLPADRVTEAVADQALLTTFVEPGGSIQHYFAVRVANWPQRTLPLRLPREARPIAIRVDGFWLPGLVPTEVSKEGILLELPVPDSEARISVRPAGTNALPAARSALLDPRIPEGGTVHSFEVVYATDSPGWSLGTCVEAPAPLLPMAPLSFRRTWRLPPGISPLTDRKMRRLPGPGEGHAPPSAGTEVGGLVRLTGALPRPLKDREASPGQRQALADAALGLRTGRAGQTLKLREVVDQVSFDYLKGHGPLVIDAVALAEMGVGPETILKITPPTSAEDVALPWVEIGLATVPGRAAPLLTSRRQFQQWQAAARPGPALSEPLETALAEAAEAGYDASGRFQAASRWLAGGSDSPPSEGRTARGERKHPVLLDRSAAREGWTEWEAVAGIEGEETLIVIRSEAIAVGGVMVAVALSLGLWGLQRGRLAYFLVWLGAAGLGLLWLPMGLRPLAWWPAVMGGLAALVAYLRLVSRSGTLPRQASSSSNRGLAISGTLTLFAATFLGGRAAAPTPGEVIPVFLVPGPAEAPAKQSVLAPVDLIEQLQTLARSGLASGPVLLTANYEGKVVEGGAEFGAVFQGECQTDEPGLLTLPLDGVRLVGDVWLDGAQAFPVALAAPQKGYALKVRGRGRHTVELRFRVSVTANGPERDIQFTAPRLVQNRLRFQAPPGADHVTALVKQGAQRVITMEEGERLEVDLGRVATPLHLRWHVSGAAVGPTRVQYKEAYLWDLGAEASGLRAFLLYHVSGAGVPALEVDLPAELEVRGVEARPVGARGANEEGSAFRLRDWRVETGGQARALRLDFAEPVAGDLQVLLDLAPRTPLSATVTLPIPAPRGTPVADSSYLAYRTRGLVARRLPERLLLVTGIRPADFAPFWSMATRPELHPEDYACAFRREPGQGPILGLQLRPRPTEVEVNQEVAMRAGRDQAEVQVTAEWIAPNNDLALVEWDVQAPQPLTIARVAGPEVRSWSQTGPRLQVWLERTTGAAHLEVFGWVALGANGRLEVPCFRVPAAQTQRTTIRLSAKGGLALASVDRPRNLYPLPDPRASEQELSFVASSPVYRATFDVRPSAASAAVRVLTFVEVRDGNLTFTATADFRARRGELRTVTLRLRNWESNDVRLETEEGVQRRERRRGPGERTWTIDLPPGGSDRYRLTVTGRMPVTEAAAGMALPEVTVPMAESVEYLLAVVGPDLAAETPRGLTALADPTAALRLWPGEAERLRRAGGTVWRATGPEWSLRLRPMGPPVAAAVRVFLTEQEAEVVDGQRWLHQAVFWLRHEANTDLYVALPADAIVVAASVDGAEVTPLQPGPRRLWLPLPGSAGVRRIRLRWRYDPEPDSLVRPNLQRPRIEGATDGPALWTVHVPTGYSQQNEANWKPGLARAATLNLYRAQAQTELCAGLAEMAREGNPSDVAALAAGQRRFYSLCRQAEGALERSGGQGETGPEGQSLSEWLQALYEKNRRLAATHGFETTRAEAERQVHAGAPAPDLPTPDPNSRQLAGLGRPRAVAPEGMPERGIPVYAIGVAEGQAPGLELATASGRRFRVALTASELLLALLLAVWCLARFPVALAIVRWFWPEQMLLLGAVGLLLVGPTFVVLFFLLLAFCGRVVTLARWTRHGFRQPASVSPVGSSIS
jgi:hypothetical protein